MNPRHLYSPKVLWQGFPAEKLAGAYAPAFFLKVDIATIGLIRGMLDYVADSRILRGTDIEIVAALDFLNRQMSEPLLTSADICEPPSSQWGADFRLEELLMQEMQANGFPPPPWEFRIELRDGFHYLQFRSDTTP